jgi:hypothetical protein
MARIICRGLGGGVYPIDRIDDAFAAFQRGSRGKIMVRI